MVITSEYNLFRPRAEVVHDRGRTAWVVADPVDENAASLTAARRAAEVAASLALRTAPCDFLTATHDTLSYPPRPNAAAGSGVSIGLLVALYDERRSVLHLASTGGIYAYYVPRSGASITRILTGSDAAARGCPAPVGEDVRALPIPPGRVLLTTAALPRAWDDARIADALVKVGDVDACVRVLAAAANAPVTLTVSDLP